MGQISCFAWGLWRDPMHATYRSALGRVCATFRIEVFEKANKDSN